MVSCGAIMVEKGEKISITGNQNGKAKSDQIWNNSGSNRKNYRNAFERYMSGEGYHGEWIF